MASLLSRVVASFDAIKPVPNLTGLDGEFNQLEGAAGVLNGGTTAFKIKVKTSDGTDPPVEVDQVGAGKLLSVKQSGVEKIGVANDGTMTCTAIPVLPASDPTTANQATRKSYVDGKTVSFSVGWSIVDPATASLNTRIFGSWIVPAGGTYTLTRVGVMFREGAHTSGGSLVFRVDRFGAATISDSGLNDTNNTVATTYYDNFADFTVSAGDIISCFLTTRSGSITERCVMVVLEGFRTVI